MLRWMAWVGLVLPLLVACGQVEPTLTAAAIPSGWQPVQQKGFTLALPPAWQVVTAEQTDVGGTLDGLGTANPQLRATLEQAKQLFAGGQVRLMAFDLDPTHAAPGFTTNLSLGAVPAQGAALKQLRSANAAQLRAMPNFANLADSDSKVAGLAAAEFGYMMQLQDAGGAAAPLRVDQYLWLYQDTQYLATFTTTPSQFDSLMPIFRQMLDTLRMTK
ncbi:MAG: hypothetical protein H0X37_25740 [Herpetosiphonaceae bacterium]|nr:hypothetical protein [Herpetosiphonaceae bacterium]